LLEQESLPEQEKFPVSPNCSRLSETPNPALTIIDDSTVSKNAASGSSCDFGSPGESFGIDLSGIPDVNCIVNLRHLLSEFIEAIKHQFNCKDGKSKLRVKEIKNTVLQTKLVIICQDCGWKKRVEGEPEAPLTTVKEYLTNFSEQILGNKKEKISNLRGNVNVKAVWGIMGTGGGYASLNELLSVLGIKNMNPKTFMNLERLVGNAWMDALSDVLEENGRESLKLAIHEDRFINDFFWTKVICDGGWNKRSKGHDYTAKGCVGVIIDAFTKKLLYVGIRNKYCYLCFSSKKANQKVKDHVCFMNYNGPSKSMETDILVEGFRQSEAMHNLQYLQYIGDGDSSVFYKLRQSVSYGSYIQKEECANHVTKNYTKYLHNVVKTKKGMHSKFLSNDIILKLTKNLRGAIKKNSADGGSAENLRQLLRRGPEHVFGNHKECDSGCAKKNGVLETVENRYNNLPKTILEDVKAGVENICKKADLLRNDATTNLAENYMSVAVKFVGGKQISRSKRWSYHARISGASLSYSLGPKWQSSTWKKTFGYSPCKIR